MAILWYGHFNSTPNDPRKLQAYEWARYIKSFITDGIRNGGTCFQVSAGTGMQVNVDEGIANIQGYIMRIEADYEGRYHKVLVPEAHTQYPRVDRLVLRLDLEPGDGMAGHIKPVILRGTAAASPIAPALTRNAKVWELSLARIFVPANTLSITQANITDERFDTELCGLINSVLGLDPSAWQAQFDGFIERMLEQENDFLSTHEGKFLNQLQEIQNDYNSWKETIDNWKSLTLDELAQAVSFSFDNQLALAGTKKETAETDNGCVSVIKWTASNEILAEQTTEEKSDGSIEIIQKVFMEDGSVFRHVKMIISEVDGVTVSEVENV